MVRLSSEGSEGFQKAGAGQGKGARCYQHRELLGTGRWVELGEKLGR